MPLRCIDPATNASLHAFDLSTEAWRKLEAENRRARHLRMPCCSAAVTLRVSKRGTQFFAHKAVGECKTAPETEAHLRLKRIAVEAARANGWDATTEVVGTTPAGEEWRADVLAQTGVRRAAIEIQWSAQTVAETYRRHARYREAGIRCLWLIRRGDCPSDRELPAASISGSLDSGLSAVLPTYGGQHVPMPEFFDAVFGGRLRFGLPLGAEARVSVRAGHMHCWKCGAETRLLTGIDVAVGPFDLPFKVAGLDEHLSVFEVIRRSLPQELGIGEIKRRYSRTQNRAYLSNGCAHCDALMGEFHEHNAWHDQKVVSEFAVAVDEAWRAAIRDHDGYEDGWDVYTFAPSASLQPQQPRSR